MTTANDAQDQTARAEVRQRKAEQAEREKQAVWTEMEADARRVDEKTARLRSLRLAREGAEAAAAEAAKPKPPPKRRKTAASR